MGLFEQRFGKPWDDDRLKDVPGGLTPVGKPCRVCGEAIKADDQGVQVYSVGQAVGRSERILAPIHREHIDRFLGGGEG